MKAFKIIKSVITSVDPLTASVLGVATFGIFAAIYILLRDVSDTEGKEVN